MRTSDCFRLLAQRWWQETQAAVLNAGSEVVQA